MPEERAAQLRQVEGCPKARGRDHLDLTQQEIAMKLGIPIVTVKARMARGMRRLAAIVGGGELS